jgi:hypothetical protein
MGRIRRNPKRPTPVWWLASSAGTAELVRSMSRSTRDAACCDAVIVFPQALDPSIASAPADPSKLLRLANAGFAELSIQILRAFQCRFCGYSWLGTGVL